MLNHVRGIANAHMLDWAARMLAAAMLIAGLTSEALRYLNAESPAGVHTIDERSSYSTMHIADVACNLCAAHNFCRIALSKKACFCACVLESAARNMLHTFLASMVLTNYIGEHITPLAQQARATCSAQQRAHENLQPGGPACMLVFQLPQNRP